jgi:hypothetical protein
MSDHEDLVTESFQLLMAMKSTMDPENAGRIFDRIAMIVKGQAHADCFAALAGVIAALARRATNPDAVAPMLQQMVKEIGMELCTESPSTMLN